MLPSATWLVAQSDLCFFLQRDCILCLAAMRALTPVNNAGLFGPGLWAGRFRANSGRTPHQRRSSMSGINRQAEPRRTAKSTRITEEGNWFALFAENFMHEIRGVPGAELFQQVGSMEIYGTTSVRERRDNRHGYLHRGARVARVDIRQQRPYAALPIAPVPYAGNLQNSRSASDRRVRYALSSCAGDFLGPAV